LYINYDGRTNQPSLFQLQPIRNNNDPLNIVIGNPDLKPSFQHSMYFNFWDSKVLQKRSFGIYGNFSLTQNAFSNKNTVDTLGKTTSQTVNVNGNYSGNIGFDFNKTFKWQDLFVAFRPSINVNKNTNYVNNKENVTNSYNLRLGITIGKEIEKN